MQRNGLFYGLAITLVWLLVLADNGYADVNSLGKTASEPISVSAEEIDEAKKVKGLNSYGKLPLYFIENKGQLDPKVRFYVKTPGQTLYFTDEGIVFDLLRREKEAGKRSEGVEKGRQATVAKTERLVFNLEFENIRERVLIEGLYRQDAGINYFVGNDRSKWKTGIPTYKGVIYQGVYKGIDLKVFGNGKDIEYEFIVNPGANPEDILLTYNGIEGLSTNGEGELLIATAFGELKETRPYIYQEIEGKREVAGSFEIRSPVGGSQTGKFSYGFDVASYDPSYPLVIDPTLSYSTYLGGSGGDYGYGIAVDSSGNAYVTGYTTSSDFPTKNPYQGTHGGGYRDAFITKLSASGSTLVYSTYLGGSGGDYGYGIAVDSSGNAYVTGETRSGDFPTQNPYQGSFAGGGYWYGDVFITKLSSSGSALVYSTYLGGSGGNIGSGITVDGAGNAYVTGTTCSSDFPTKNPYQGTYGGGDCDAFITKLSASGSTLTYSTYLGGSRDEYGEGIAVDSSGNAYVTGYTGSSDFPTKNPYQGYFAGWVDTFITKLSASGNTLSYSTYLGGSSWDYVSGIAVDSSGSAYVTGRTAGDFPTKNPYQGSVAGAGDVFITKLSPSGSTLTYSTYLGGSRDEYGNGIAVGGSGNAYVAGTTLSNDFPTKNPYQGSFAGGSKDAFITKLSPSGNALSYSTYLGGSGNDYGRGIAVGGSGNTYVTGYTDSTNFPMQNPYQGAIAGSFDAFVTKLSVGSEETTFQWPVDNPSITQSYACEGCYVPGKYHTGLDITSSTGNITLYASGSGTVIRINNNTYPNENHCMGNVVIIGHNNGIYSLYAHMASISVTDGQDVTKGDPIGVMGNTGSGGGLNGATFGVHLHFEVKSWPVLGSLDNDLGPLCTDSTLIKCNNWGYTPDKPNWYGYINPYPYFEYTINDITPTPIRITTNNAPVRTGPDPSYTQYFATASSGQEFIAISEYGGWYLVYIPSNNGPTTGWIQGAVESSGTILEVNDPARGIEGVRVRDIPSTSSGNIISYVWDDQLFLKKNQAPTGNGCSKQWYEIYLPDGLSSLSGWVCGEYLHVPISSDVLFVNKDDGTCGGNTPCYTTIQDAINAASTGASIKIAQGTYSESVTLNESKSLTLQGGWGSSYSTQTSNATFIKAPKATQGSLTLQELTIRP